MDKVKKEVNYWILPGIPVRKAYTLDYIAPLVQEIIKNVLDIDVIDKRQSKIPKKVLARSIYAKLVRDYCSCTLEQVAKLIDREYTTVMHNIKVLNEQLFIKDTITVESYTVVEKLLRKQLYPLE